jgi:hypothetical protein
MAFGPGQQGQQFDRGAVWRGREKSVGPFRFLLAKIRYPAGGVRNAANGGDTNPVARCPTLKFITGNSGGGQVMIPNRI